MIHHHRFVVFSSDVQTQQLRAQNSSPDVTATNTKNHVFVSMTTVIICDNNGVSKETHSSVITPALKLLTTTEGKISR